MSKPEIRLKGFVGEWHDTLLKDICDVNPSSNIPDVFEYVDLESVVGTSIVSHRTEKRGSAPSRAQRLAKNSDIFYQTVRPYQKNNCIYYEQGSPYVFSTGYAQLRSQICPEYLFNILQTDTFVNEVLLNCTGTSYPAINPTSLSNLKICYSDNSDEQKSIANYFKSLDSMIQSTTKMIESLRQMKQACLVSMFPQAGETTPRLRFKGFKEEWERKSFGDLYYQNVVKNDMSFGTDNIISVANMYFNPNSYISDQNYLRTYNIFRLGDIAFEGNKSKNFAHGRFVENTIGEGIVSHVFDVFTPKSDKHDLYYWKYAINNERIMGPILVRCTKASTMMTNLVAKDFLKEYTLVPSYEEQKKIGSFFRILDTQISLQEARLEKLKQIKSACLDKMFV